jgi:hypothetical protein
MSEKVVITASPEAADLLFKAVNKVVTDEEHTETIDDFQNQNPATKRLVEEVDKAYDTMIESLLKQVEKILASEDKAITEVKVD